MSWTAVRYETITLYCPNSACRHAWPAEVQHDSECHYHDLDDSADAACPECGELGCEERPYFDDEETD